MKWEEHYRKLEQMYARAPINRFFEPRLSVSRGRAQVVIAIREDFFHAANAVHGSVYFKAMDDAAFFAANSLIRDYFVLTVHFDTYLTRPVSKGEMKAEGRVVHQSRRLLIAEAVLTDSKDRQIARGSGSFMPSRKPLGPEIGYL